MTNVSVGFTDQSINALLKNIKWYEAEVEKRATRVVARFALKIERDAKRNAPVDTGRLRAEIHHILQGLAAAVISSVDYSVAVHEGTSRMAGRPYLLNAFESNRKAFHDDLIVAINGAAKDL